MEPEKSEDKPMDAKALQAAIEEKADEITDYIGHLSHITGALTQPLLGLRELSRAAAALEMGSAPESELMEPAPAEALDLSQAILDKLALSGIHTAMEIYLRAERGATFEYLTNAEKDEIVEAFKNWNGQPPRFQYRINEPPPATPADPKKGGPA